MAMTETKRKYLLTIALLHKAPCLPFRPIDLAVRLGVSRASVSRMLLEFVKNDDPNALLRDAETLRSWLGEGEK